MKKQLTVLVSGSRQLPETAENLERLEAALDEIYCQLAIENEQHDYPTHLAHGGAAGADQLAKRLAVKMGLEEIEMKPDYRQHHPKTAPLHRNGELVKLADVTIAWYAPGQVGKGGTADTARKTTAAGKPLLELLPDGTTRWTPAAKTLL
jgi:hypothetical protein